MKCERREAARRRRSSKYVLDYADFKALENQALFLMNNARREFFSTFIDENSDNQRKLFRATARLLKPSTVIPLPQCDDDKVLANNFGKLLHL